MDKEKKVRSAEDPKVFLLNKGLVDLILNPNRPYWEWVSVSDAIKEYASQLTPSSREEEQDYKDTAEYKLSVLLCELTGSRMSYTTYSLDTMRTAINDFQQEFYYSSIKEDVAEILKSGGTAEDVVKYINDL